MGSLSDANAVGGKPEAGDHLDPEEVAAAYEALSPDDKLKLMAVERQLLGGTGRQPKELFWEAMYRARCRKRRCPRHVPVMAFLVEAMRSIASHDREHHRRHASLEDDADTVERVRSLPGALASEMLTPEEALLEKESSEEPSAVDVIVSHFDSDEQAQLVVMGWAAGMRGKELRDFVEVDQDRLDYLGKKIRRKMLKLYPNGYVS
jgi:hypothetical protein